MRIKELLITIAVTLLVSILLMYVFSRMTQKRVAVVDTGKLFNEYRLKKELEKDVNDRIQYLKHVSDSFEIEIKSYGSVEKVPKEMIGPYQNIRMNIDLEYDSGSRNINEQVWKRLNPLLQKFGAENKLDLIIGANGMGTVLYTDENLDVTAKVIQYVNNNYEGK